LKLDTLPFVSIVVPLYNEVRWIDACIEALLAQDYPADRYEILIVDNNSTDASVQRAQRYAGVRVFHEPVQGDYAARNRGVKESRGEILAFTDSDTSPRPEWLRAIVAHMQKTGASLLIGRLQYGTTRSLRLLEAYEAEKGEFVFSSGKPSIYFGYTCNMAATRELLDRLGCFPPVFRNADVVLVRQAVDQLSASALAFCDAMRVRRLEVASIRQYLGKQIAYGRDFPRYADIAAASPLSGRERFHVFGRTVRRNHLGVVDVVLLLSILAVGAVCYDSARRRATARQPVAATS
jgi:glycosyltransferase involved in cell wall biosynthesis